MPLTFLDVHNVRIIQRAILEPSSGLNVLEGPNGSGKTSILEAIHILGVGRSFRSNRSKDIISRKTNGLMVFARYRNHEGTTINTGIQRYPTGYEIKINGETEERLANLAKVFPVQCITTDSHYGFLHSAKQRRALLNWGLFHVEQKFYPLWLQNQRLLKQRSCSLRSGGLSTELDAWDEQLITVGEELHQFREVYVRKWNDSLKTYNSLLGFPDSQIQIDLYSGWNQDQSLAQALATNRERDRTKGLTHSGPHRADIRVRFDGEKISEFASHGQQKLLVIALRLAQMELFFEETRQQPILLLDDLPAELDRPHRARLMEKLSAQPLQIFATTTDTGQIPTSFWSEVRVFHVEQGEIKHAKSAA